MKKLAAVLLALALFAPCALAESNFPVYQVRAPGSEATVYLFPSIHAADERAYPLSSIVQNAYSASDFLAVECDVIAAESDILTSLRVMQKIRLPAGQRVTRFIPQELFEQAKAFLIERNRYANMYENCHPYLLGSAMENAILAECGLEEQGGLDLYFLQRAREDGKAILEMETAEKQAALVVDQLPAGVWTALLKSYLPPNDAVKRERGQALYEALLQGDSDAVEALLASEGAEIFAPEEQDLFDAYNNTMLVQRGEKMTAAVLGYLKEGKNVFVAVGAAHVLGAEGLVNSLQNAGCAVRRIE